MRTIADDVAAMEYDSTDIARSLENIEAASSELGLHISWAKAKVQNLGAGPSAADLSVNGQTVEGVQRFVYLGSSISSADGSRSEQLRRICIAASNMGTWSASDVSHVLSYKRKYACICP